jgi:hypothetical protein
MATMHKLLSKLFGPAEEINGHNYHDVYLYRWTLLETRWFKIYLHHFVGDDWARDLHDHPKRFVSIGLWGSYTEEYMRNPRIMSREGSFWFNQPTKIEYRAPWVRSFAPEHTHRLVDVKNAWTLVIVGPRRRDWGFWHDGQFVPWPDYVYDQHWIETAHGVKRLYAYKISDLEVYAGKDFEDAVAAAMRDTGQERDSFYATNAALSDDYQFEIGAEDGIGGSGQYETVRQLLYGIREAQLIASDD